MDAILAIAFVLLLAIPLAFAWHWHGDGRRDLRRCPKCWHDLSGIEGMRCTECGRASKSEKSLHRQRRSLWRLAPIPLVLLMSGSILWWRVTPAQTAQATPTSALVWMLPIVEYLPDAWEWEIEQRVGVMSNEQLITVIDWAERRPSRPSDAPTSPVDDMRPWLAAVFELQGRSPTHEQLERAGLSFLIESQPGNS